jgi:hypothetical protein
MTDNLPSKTITSEAFSRGLASERDYADGQLDAIRERLRGIDIATIVLNDTVNRVPTDVQKEVSVLRELSDVKFASVETQFKERDTRQVRESRDNEVAVNAAFAAQKEAASEQNKSNSLAISKSESSTAETLNKLAELFKTTTDSLSDKIDDVKARVDRSEAKVIGSSNATQDRRVQSTELRGWMAFAVTVVLFVPTFIALVISIVNR